MGFLPILLFDAGFISINKHFLFDSSFKESQLLCQYILLFQYQPYDRGDGLAKRSDPQK